MAPICKTHNCTPDRPVNWHPKLNVASADKLTVTTRSRPREASGLRRIPPLLMMAYLRNMRSQISNLRSATRQLAITEALAIGYSLCWGGVSPSTTHPSHPVHHPMPPRTYPNLIEPRKFYFRIQKTGQIGKQTVKFFSPEQYRHGSGKTPPRPKVLHQFTFLHPTHEI